MNIIMISFGDWFENQMSECEWSHWSEMYGISNVIDVGWWEYGVGDNKLEWKETLEKFAIRKWGDYVMDITNEDISEFGYMFFNVDEFMKLDGKVLRLKGDGWEVVEESKDMELEIGGEYMDGEMKYVVVLSRDLSCFKVMEWSEGIEDKYNGRLIF